MVEGKGKFEWSQTASLMALTVNLMRDPRKGQSVSPNDFNPFAPRPKVPVLKGKEMLSALKAAFSKPKSRRANRENQPNDSGKNHRME